MSDLLWSYVNALCIKLDFFFSWFFPLQATYFYFKKLQEKHRSQWVYKQLPSLWKGFQKAQPAHQAHPNTHR